VFGREGDRVGFGGVAAAAEQQDQEEDLLPSRPQPHIHVGWLAATTPPPSPAGDVGRHHRDHVLQGCGLSPVATTDGVIYIEEVDGAACR